MIDYIDVFKENIELTQENKYLQKKLDEFEEALEYASSEMMKMTGLKEGSPEYRHGKESFKNYCLTQAKESMK